MFSFFLVFGFLVGGGLGSFLGFWKIKRKVPNNGALAGVGINRCYYYYYKTRVATQHLMSILNTRSKLNLQETSIHSLGLFINDKNSTTTLRNKTEYIDVILDSNAMDVNNSVQADEEMKITTGHDLNDQCSSLIDNYHPALFQSPLRTIEKYDGSGDAEQWLKSILAKFELFHLTSMEKYNFLSDILAGEALIWYGRQQASMPNFVSFINKFLKYYGSPLIKQDELPSVNSPVIQPTTIDNLVNKQPVINSFRTKMLMHNLEKLPKFTGKSKQNVSKWLREFQQAMHICNLSDEEKLFFVSSWLEAEARDWFFDNTHLFPTWSVFVTKLMKTFESSGKADTAFNRLRHYEQGVNQDVRQYYFEIMKLCKETNLNMDEASQLQYLKDGLKPSLRFDILLKDPKSTEEFLEYAQRIEQLKSLVEKQTIDDPMENYNISSSMSNTKSNNNITDYQRNSSQQNSSSSYGNTSYENNSFPSDSSRPMATATTTSNQYNNDIPKPPYQCYKCGGIDHFIRNCPHFP